MNVDLYCGDCLDIFPRLNPNSVDLVLTDPPYGTTACKHDVVIPFEPMWNELDRICKDNAAIIMTASQPFTSLLVTSNIEMFKHEWIWIKNRGSNFANTVREPMKEHESVLVFSKGGWTYNKQMQPRTGGGLSRSKYNAKLDSKSENYGNFKGIQEYEFKELRVPSSWQKFNTEVGLHPNQKPVPLMEYLIKTYSNENDVVLDFSFGSGTSGVAAKKLKRNYVGIEKEEYHFLRGKKRIEETEVPKNLFDCLK